MCCEAICNYTRICVACLDVEHSLPFFAVAMPQLLLHAEKLAELGTQAAKTAKREMARQRKAIATFQRLLKVAVVVASASAAAVVCCWCLLAIYESRVWYA